MENKLDNKYDAVIIGAGIGGLVCGCYLAKRGLKILLVERKSKPGGFCNSFKVKNFYFDGCVHSLGDLSPGGNFFKILNEINVLDKLKLIRHNPIDKIVSPHYELTFYDNINDTITSVSKSFPNEKKNFISFLDLVLENDAMINVSRLLNKTFEDILDQFFKNQYLKRILSLPTFGNVGVPAKYLNAFTAIKHYKSFLIDGGYYPVGGIQDIPDKILSMFRQYGGHYISSRHVKRIITKNGIAKGIQLNDGCVYESKYVISACDSKHTFLDLLDESKLNKKIVNKLNRMIPSLSLFIIYLGLKDNYRATFINRCNCWYIYDYNYDRNFPNSFENNENNLKVKWIMILPNYSNKTCLVFAGAPYATKDFWEENKDRLRALVLSKLEKESPGITDALELKTCSTPHSLENWTMSSNGAPYGWASTLDQFIDLDFTGDRIIRNLFLSSHWSTIASGVSGVAMVGKRTAEIIISDITKNKE